MMIMIVVCQMMTSMVWYGMVWYGMVGIDVEEELSQSGQAQLDLKVHYTNLSLSTY
jgi:hypothetical protein